MLPLVMKQVYFRAAFSRLYLHSLRQIDIFLPKPTQTMLYRLYLIISYWNRCCSASRRVTRNVCLYCGGMEIKIKKKKHFPCFYRVILKNTRGRFGEHVEKLWKYEPWASVSPRPQPIRVFFNGVVQLGQRSFSFLIVYSVGIRQF